MVITNITSLPIPSVSPNTGNHSELNTINRKFDASPSSIPMINTHNLLPYPGYRKSNSNNQRNSSHPSQQPKLPPRILVGPGGAPTAGVSNNYDNMDRSVAPYYPPPSQNYTPRNNNNYRTNNNNNNRSTYRDYNISQPRSSNYYTTKPYYNSAHTSGQYDNQSVISTETYPSQYPYHSSPLSNNKSSSYNPKYSTTGSYVSSSESVTNSSVSMMPISTMYPAIISPTTSSNPGTPLITRLPSHGDTFTYYTSNDGGISWYPFSYVPTSSIPVVTTPENGSTNTNPIINKDTDNASSPSTSIVSSPSRTVSYAPPLPTSNYPIPSSTTNMIPASPTGVAPFQTTYPYSPSYVDPSYNAIMLAAATASMVVQQYHYMHSMNPSHPHTPMNSSSPPLSPASAYYYPSQTALSPYNYPGVPVPMYPPPSLSINSNNGVPSSSIIVHQQPTINSSTSVPPTIDISSNVTSATESQRPSFTKNVNTEAHLPTNES